MKITIVILKLANGLSKKFAPILKANLISTNTYKCWSLFVRLIEFLATISITFISLQYCKLLHKRDVREISVIFFFISYPRSNRISVNKQFHQSVSVCFGAEMSMNKLELELELEFLLFL